MVQSLIPDQKSVLRNLLAAGKRVEFYTTYAKYIAESGSRFGFAGLRQRVQACKKNAGQRIRRVRLLDGFIRGAVIHRHRAPLRPMAKWALASSLIKSVDHFGS